LFNLLSNLKKEKKKKERKTEKEKREKKKKRRKLTFFYKSSFFCSEFKDQRQILPGYKAFDIKTLIFNQNVVRNLRILRLRLHC